MAAAPAGHPRHAPLRLHPLWTGGPVRHALRWTEGCRLRLLLPRWTENPPRHLPPLIDQVLCRRPHHHWRRSTKTELRHPPGHRKDSQVSPKMLGFYAPVLVIAVSGGIMSPIVRLFYSCEHDSSGTPSGNFFNFGADVHLDSKMN